MTCRTDSSEAALAHSADDMEFSGAFEQYRRDVVVLCYRFLGSLSDAEDAAQETALRAWRGWSSFRREASTRTWMHRIASRVCLDIIDVRGRRLMPTQRGHPSDPAESPAPPKPEILWLEPLPDSFLVDAALDPAATYSLNESVSLAFVAALQLLPPRQRAVVVLRDVLAWSAVETAHALAITVSAANSLLNRARARLAQQEVDRESLAPARLSEPDQRLLDAYMSAWSTDDVSGLVAILREEVRLAMPPSPAWYRGRASVLELFARWVLPMGPFRMQPTGANLQPAAILLRVGADGSEEPLGVHVLTAVSGQIVTIDAFMDPRIAERLVVEGRTDWRSGQ